MANNCDYCHKPLSLMRRLRGEQFCSIEHMDLYAAQQAEFALERLAASVTERPNTERPPAIPRPKLRPKAAPIGDSVVETPETVRVSQQPDLQTAVALQEQEQSATPETPQPLPSPATITPATISSDSEYPLAAYLAEHPVEAKTSDSTAKVKKTGLAPVDHWGKVSPAWSMPPFHSEPGDPRTWNAGKLVSQIPPIAGWRELLSPMDVKPVESAEDAYAELPNLEVAVEQITALSAQTELRNVFPERLTQFRTLSLQQSTIESVIPAEHPLDLVWSVPSVATVAESVQSGFRMVESRLNHATYGSLPLGLQTLALQWQDIGGPQFATPSPIPGGMISAETAINGLAAAGLQRLPWTGKAQASTGMARSDVPMGPALPEASFALPQPGPWNWKESFRAPSVALPELLPVPMPPAVESTAANSWQDIQGTLQNPAIQWIAPHLGYNGPNFGWESSHSKTMQAHSGTVPEMARFAEIDTLASHPRVVEFHARVRAGLAGPGPLPSGWSTPKVDATKLEVGPQVNLRPTVTTMAIQVRPLLPVRAAHLESVHGAASTLVPSRGQAPVLQASDASLSAAKPSSSITLASPAPSLLCPMVTLRSPKASAFDNGKVSLTGPVKYSPVAIVVLPPPQFALRPAVLSDEQRYVAQVPNGVWRLPRVRHTGYRSLGPFPKLPLRLPDQYLRTVPSEVPPPFVEIPRTRVRARQDVAGLPSFLAPKAMRVHPADYFSWPEPKGVRISRALPERQELPKSDGPVTARKFGPGRAGLQSKNRSADGLARGSA